jgi:hypothetical protein
MAAIREREESHSKTLLNLTCYAYNRITAQIDSHLQH